MDTPGSNIWISLPLISAKESGSWFPKGISTRATRSRCQWSFSLLERITMPNEVFEAQVSKLRPIYSSIDKVNLAKVEKSVEQMIRPL